VAMATAPGRGAIGVVRLSGQGLGAFAQTLCGRVLPARQAALVRWCDANGETIDRGLALWFPAPHSYTGEDVLELQGHGGPVVMGRLLERVLELGRASFGALGVRLAQAGEFTQRAFLHGQLDLAQAEAVADLIDASTRASARAAMRSLEGAFSQRVHRLVEALRELRALVEATIDFPEEDDVAVLEQWNAHARLADLQTTLVDLIDRAHQGVRLRTGLVVVLAGEPNVGKSSLLNALAGRDLALVSPWAGTTRDRLEHVLDVDGLALTLIDTAGLRVTQDPIEQLGIARARDAIERADLILHLVDNDEVRPQPTLPTTVPVLRVRNKIDRDALSAARDDRPQAYASAGEVRLSALTQEGLPLLRERLRALAGLATGEPDFIARERHLQALLVAQQHLVVAMGVLESKRPAIELFAEELRLAQESMDAITGAFGADDLLGMIFGRFCIGK